MNLNKPPGKTSRDLVNLVQRLTNRAKAGHAGTLDPLATGVLVVCVGPATRLVEYVQRMPKRYRGTFLLGRTSDTEDIQGTVQNLQDPPRASLAQIESVLPGFVGEIQQFPPAFSALKVKGRRAYDLARAGQEFQLASRPIKIHSIELVRYEYPELELNVRCGSGTYIRSLGRDIARAVGTEAIMSALTRTAIGEFHLQDSIDIESLTAENIAGHLQPAVRAVACLPQLELNDDELHRLSLGQSIDDRWQMDADEIAAIGPHGELCAILGRRGKQQLRPMRNFPQSTGSG